MKEYKLFERRKAVFIQEGLPEDEADRLADRLMLRDRDPYDDRRVCFECANYINKKCFRYPDRYGRPDTPPRFTLMRCEYFDLKGSS